MIEWKNRCKETKENGKPVPQVTNYIGECFLKLQIIYPIVQIL